MLLVVLLLAGGLLLYQIPRIKRALGWRLDIILTYLRGVVNPAQGLPTPAVSTQSAFMLPTGTPLPLTATLTPTPMISPTPTLTSTPIPDRVFLDPPAYDEKKDRQDWNNCGPATLALYLRYFGWDGDQFDVSRIIKPTRDDRNVNVEELVFYVRTHAGWLNAEYRVGGDIDTVRKFIAAGIPVMIEETFKTDRQYWPEDDQWAGHYLLITAYDDESQQFTAQDSEIGPNQKIPYSNLDKNWQSFNRVYILVFFPEEEQLIQELLGEDWDIDVNRQHALETAELETQLYPDNAFTWFNLGTNLTYFERYHEAALAYDNARNIGLPQRMLRYQFAPFIAYFHSGRTEELMTLTKFALEITRVSEEARLWRGWGFYRMGDKSASLTQFRDALKVRPDYEDALYAIEYITNN